MIEVKKSHRRISPTINGIVDEETVLFIKRTFLFDTFRSLTELVKIDQEYPEKNSSDVNFNLDIVILTSDEYKKLKNGNSKTGAKNFKQ